MGAPAQLGPSGETSHAVAPRGARMFPNVIFSFFFFFVFSFLFVAKDNQTIKVQGVRAGQVSEGDLGRQLALAHDEVLAGP